MLIEYDVTDVPPEPPSKRMKPRVVSRGKAGTRPEKEQAPPGSFAARVESRRVDLVDLVEHGLPPIVYVPASDGMLVCGKRHLIPAPHKTGKSLGMQVHWVDVALAGGTVMILDRENGRDLYAKRLADIFEARQLGKEQRSLVQQRLGYYEFPTLRKGDAESLVEHFGHADVVVFDSQRMFLSDFGLKESESDDYASFMAYAVDPLFQAGVATLILDNTGHDNQSRARGSVAKGDLNEVLFSMKAEADFDLYRRGRLGLKIEHSRFGNSGEWTMEIGAGVFEPWRPAEAPTGRDDFLAAVLDVLSGGQALGQDKLIDAAREKDVSIGTPAARDLLRGYVEDAACPVLHKDYGYVREGS